MENKYISVSEFADLAGVTRQAVYKRLSTDLKPFVREVDGKKTMSEAALSLFVSTVSTDNVEQPKDNRFTAENKLVSLLERELERVNRQLEETTEMLRSEQAKNATLQEQILKLSNEFCEITKQSNVLVSQAQQLQALQAPRPEPEPVAPEKKGLFGIFKKNNRGN